MAETDASDALLDSFNRKVIARQNLRCLDASDASDAGKKETGKSTPSEDEEAEKAPFKPSPL